MLTTATEAINLFALDVYEQMQNEQGNLFYSPLSISTGLAMTSAAAAGLTAAEMQEVLHLGSDPAIHATYGELLSSFETIIEDKGEAPDILDYSDVEEWLEDYVEWLNTPATTQTLDSSNAIWPQLGLPIDSDFINTIENDYGGLVQSLDYSNPEHAEDTINAWVADQTNGKIEDLVENLDPLTAMVLTNTVYFDGLWEEPFDPDYTIGTTFYRDIDDAITTTSMFGQPSNVSRTQIDGFDVLNMPFQYGDTSMVIYMPVEQNGQNDVASETLVAIGEWLDSSPSAGYIEVRLPTFTTTIETDFGALLAGLGMPSAFDPIEADFTAGIPQQGIYLSDVLHKATVSFTEQGVEAAAATEIGLLLCFAAGTPVLTPSGEKPIEELFVGDVVLARNEHNMEGELEPKVVEQTKQGEANILEIHVADRVIRTTELHPFFVYKQGWTPARKVEAGQRLATSEFGWVDVDKVVDTQASETVYNIRVADHHTYFVGSKEWGFAVWVHNFYDTGYYVDQPFHFMIRDNATSTILFMGRIDDPTQLENEVSPVYTEPTLPGDYNGDLYVDNADYDAWRAAYGQTGDDLAADGNNDGVVDNADYAVWRNNLGAGEPPVSTPAAATVVENTAEEEPAEIPAEEVEEGPAERTRAAFFQGRRDIGSREFRPVFESARSRIPDNDLLLLAEDRTLHAEEQRSPEEGPRRERSETRGPSERASRFESLRAAFAEGLN